MTLAELPMPIGYDEAVGLALVFSPQLATRLAELHAQHGTPNAIPRPRAMTDGRMMLGAELLTEVVPGGLLHDMWEAADKAVLMESVEVIPMSEAVALLPREDS